MKRQAETGTGVVTWKDGEGIAYSAEIVGLSPQLLTLETVDPDLTLRASEVLPELEARVDDECLYSGRAVVTKVLNARSRLLFDIALDPPGLHPRWPAAANLAEVCRAGYEDFFGRWNRESKVTPEFKALVTDVGSFLGGVQRWLDQMETGLAGRFNGNREAQELEVVRTLAAKVIPAFNQQHEKFEALAYAVPPEFRGVHQDLVRRHWQPFFLISPFGRRTFRKPLGYAGDYEMMDMIHRNAPEGATLFAKLSHALLVSQWPAESVRNRIAYLRETLVTEIARVARLGRRARILNVGCGPAKEVQYLLRDTALSNEADFALLDFNEETIAYTGNKLATLRREHGRQTSFEMVKMSVHQMLRGRFPADASGSPKRYDLIYCAGLFDYLSQQTCRALVKIFYDHLQPGGEVLVANMNDAQPFRNFIEYVLDWHLIYRNTAELWDFCPAGLHASARVVAEPTAANMFLHVRKGD